jgi:hypothetical protein
MSIQAISELTGWDRKTIRKYMQAAGVVPEYGPRERLRASKAQVDWGHLGTLLRLHEAAFQQIGGLRSHEDGVARNGRAWRDCLALGVSGLRAVLGIHAAIVPTVSRADERVRGIIQWHAAVGVPGCALVRDTDGGEASDRDLAAGIQ